MSAPHDASTQPAPTDTFRDVLHSLVTLGADLAHRLHAAATQPEAPQPAPAPDAATPLIRLAAAFDKMARTVRRCIALAQSLDAPRPSAKDPATHRAAARRRIIRDVEDTIQRAAAEDGIAAPDTPGQLRAELRDRLDAPDLDWDLLNRPVADIIADIRRDLGIAAQPGTQPWKRRTPADLRRLHALAAAPSGAAAQAAEPEDPDHPTPNPPGHGGGPRHHPGWQAHPAVPPFQLAPASVEAGLRWPPSG